MPCKKFYRQRAHCNPLSDSYIKYPVNYRYVNWHLHYPHYFPDLEGPDEKMDGEKKKEMTCGQKGQINQQIADQDGEQNNIQRSDEINEGTKPLNNLYLNTNIYPITYEKILLTSQVNTHEIAILDVGCGYGGLLFALSSTFNNKLILGLEIRDKVTNYVGEKINSYRKNYFPNYNNISVIRTNAMKFLPNYIKKNQIEKFFFCFPDPHFKKQNWRRRIITIENLSLYHHLLQKNGMIYFITDVFTLYLWTKLCFSKYPYFKLLSTEEYKNDICIKLIHQSSEESKRVKKNNQTMYFLVAKKI
ncbi:methyltransferase, putative [Plasmodium malariae]|uniref:tRNA (guanine-N(7)-)-methyltransferase n=1 Tax=Plasmodium malariae TaxID=5858 RepID=A0A1C3KCQ4_PLAMA|nr:methyltransferase, putative [Plasmodium malariae]